MLIKIDGEDPLVKQGIFRIIDFDLCFYGKENLTPANLSRSFYFWAMRYLIQKKLGQVKHWWNEKDRQWEGLKSNATFIYPSELDDIMIKLRKKYDENHITYYQVD